jgi:hypothetical protein
MDYAQEGSIGKFDEVVTEHGVTAVVDSNAVPAIPRAGAGGAAMRQ